MRVNQGIDLIIQETPLSFSSGIEVIAGSLNQIYDKENGEYLPDRRITPLKLRPWVKAFDSVTKIAYNNITIASVTWYYNTKNSKDILTARENCTSSTVTISNKEYPIVIIKENIPVDTVTSTTEKDYPSEIIAKIKFYDPRFAVNEEDDSKNTYLTCEETIQLHTYYYVAHSWKLELNQPQFRFIDPTKVTRASANSIVAPVTLQATLYDKDTVVRDSSESINTSIGETSGNVMYFWKYYNTEDSTWAAINSDCPWLVTNLSSGTPKGTIQVNADAFNSLRIRCYAEPYETTDLVPQAPKDNSILYAETTLKRRMPVSVYANVVADRGTILSNSSSNNPIKMHVEIFDTTGQIEDVDKYYKVVWFKQAPGGNPTELRDENNEEITGSTLTTTASALGIDKSMRVFPEIYELGAYTPVSASEAGQSLAGYTTTSSLTTANKQFIVAQKINK